MSFQDDGKITVVGGYVWIQRDRLLQILFTKRGIALLPCLQAELMKSLCLFCICVLLKLLRLVRGIALVHFSIF